MTTAAESTVFVPLNAEGSHVLRVSIRSGEDGAPQWLALVRGFGQDGDFRPSFDDVFTLPYSRLGALVGALEQLGAVRAP